jgi:hypothetical protein
MLNLKKYSGLLAGFFFWGEATAQDIMPATGPMVTDRPDATESARIVPRTYLQIESGSYYESFREGNGSYRTHGYNTTLIRYGLLDNLELRLGWDYEEQIARVAPSTSSLLSGLSPLLFGVKVAISEEKTGGPAMAVLGHLALPFFAGVDFRPATTGIDLRFAFSHTLSEKSSLGYNLGAEIGGDDPQLRYHYSMSYGYAMTSSLGFYMEVYGDFPELGSADHYADLGATYLIRPNVEFDATLGKSITQGQDLLLSAGVSFRFPD